MKVHRLVAALFLTGVVATDAWSVTADDVAKLEHSLTATGAEAGASADGQIPAFAAMSKPEAGWSWGKQRLDYWKYKDEKPLYVIDASNVDKYADKLTEGQIQMLKQVKGYTMPVYPTHRECGIPEQVAENTKAGALKSAIGKDGWSLANATLPGVPFPIPDNGIQAVWNWLMRYAGVAEEITDGYTYLSPRPGTSQPIITRWSSLFYFPWAEKGQHSPQSVNDVQNGFYYIYKEPAALAGQGTMQRFYFDKDSDTYYYFTGQRRVRRLPAYSYDAPLIGYENQYPADMVSIFSGNPDRFDWKLVGKKEIYIPYNGFALQTINKSLKDIVADNFIKPEFRRYELHRVWEVVGTVKSGVRHSTPKKTLYFDEDSWIVAVGDDYDAQGKIWKAKENYITPAWEVGACSFSASIYNDVISGRYLVDTLVVGTGKDMKLYSPAEKDPRFNENWFTGENLGAISAQ
jgi:hypothetical protein